VFGKSGTTDRDKTAALIVGTTSIVVAGYMVNPDYADHPDRMDHDVVNPAVYETVADYMDGRDKEEFEKPDNKKLTFGEQGSIPNVECASIGDARSRIEYAGFDASVLTSPVDSRCPAGTAAGTNPSGRTIKGGVVMIEVSNGKAGQPETPKPSPPTIPGFPPRPRR
jgi:hypothetical protein